MDRNSRTARQQHGFTIMQMVVALAIISVVSTVGVLGVKSAREHFKMQTSARLFASYTEKARADSVRRHAASGQEDVKLDSRVVGNPLLEPNPRRRLQELEVPSEG